MLVDKVDITVQGGAGGNGCVSFRREKYVPKGGPDGGNGGRGGDVYVVGQNNIYLLKKFREKPLVIADKGQPGQSNKKHGADASDLVVKVPFGTKITNLKDQSQIEILNESSRFLLAQGGKGGRGNWEFRSATNQTPRQFERGTPGNSIRYRLDLQLIADVGLIGLPNAGKSTLLNSLTSARAKTADYPFTTLEPNLGVYRKLVLADIPGLIEGASQGKGLGFQFLRHVERTRLLLHCLSCESTNPVQDYQIIRNELLAYNPKLDTLAEILLLTKADVLDLTQQKDLVNKFQKIKITPLLVSVLDEASLEKLEQKLTGLLLQTADNKNTKPE